MYRKGLICIIIGSLFFITSCGKDINIFAIHNSEYNNDDILKNEYSSYSYVSKEGGANENSANLDFSLSGNDLVWTISVENDIDIQCNYDINISKGNFKVILVTADKTIENLWENQSDSLSKGAFKIPLTTGDNMVKIVGKSAEGKLNLELVSDEKKIKVSPGL